MKKIVYKKGDIVRCILHGAGVDTEEKREIERVDKSGVWLSNGYGNRPSGPFVNGKREGVYGFWDEILPLDPTPSP